MDPKEPLFMRASWRARMSGRSLGDVIEGILHAAKQVRRYYDSKFGESLFLDPTEAPPDLAERAAPDPLTPARPSPAARSSRPARKE